MIKQLNIRYLLMVFFRCNVKGCASRLGFGAMLFVLAATLSLGQDSSETEKVLPSDLSAEQRSGLILEPQFSDAFYGQVDRLYLHGFWKFMPEVNLLQRKGEGVVSTNPKPSKAPATDRGLEQGYFKPEFDVSGWDEIPVPWSWNVAAKNQPGKGISRIAFAGLGYYRVTFQVPQEKKGKRVFIHFDSVQTECKVWLNGALIGEHVNSTSDAGPYWGFNAKVLTDDFELDVTDKVAFGAVNTLVIRVYDDGLPIADGKPNDGGIMGSVWVDFRETVDFQELLVDASPDDGTVAIQARAINSGAPVKLAVEAKVEPFKSKSYTPPADAKSITLKLGEVNFPKGESDHRFTFKVPNAVAWDVNRPSLYRLRLVDGARVLGQTRFGFRKLEVRGKQFFLNGHPISLRGANGQEGKYSNSRMYGFNKGDWLRHAMTLLKEANFNLARTNGSLPRILSDICDEIGLLSEADYSLEVRSLALDDKSAQAALIAEAKVDGFMSPDGTLTPYGKATLRKWLVQLHNHPSVVMLSAGNEIGFSGKEKVLAEYMTAFYEYIKSVDMQKRLITPSAGLTIWQWNTPLPADFYDNHDYSNGDMGYMDCSAPMGDFATKHWTRIYGKIDKPLVLGECGGYESYATLRPDIQALAKDGELDRGAYVKWANGLAAEKKGVRYRDSLARMYYVNFAGVRSATGREALGVATGKITSEFIRRMRRDAGYLQGIIVHDIEPLYWGLTTSDLFMKAGDVQELASKARKNVEFLAQRQALLPLIAIPDLHDRHCFPGDALEVNVRLLNDQFATTEKSLVVTVALEDRDGKVAGTTQATFAEVLEYARVDKTLTLSIPATLTTGDYTLRTRLSRGETMVSEISTPMFVLGKSAAKAPIKTTGKIALYERAGQSATKLMLADLGIAYTAIDKMDGLAAFDVLIIGANSIDMALSLEGAKIKDWLEKGGRLVCLEQKRIGSVPFASEISFKDAGDMLFADVIDTLHPAVTGLNPAHWEVWNGACAAVGGGVSAAGKAVYSHYITPIPESVIVSGGSRAPYRFCQNPVLGMVVGEVKVGKGLVFFSQALATSRYDKDSVATQYLRNVLEYTLGPQWTGDRATVVK